MCATGGAVAQDGAGQVRQAGRPDAGGEGAEGGPAPHAPRRHVQQGRGQGTTDVQTGERPSLDRNKRSAEFSFSFVFRWSSEVFLSIGPHCKGVAGLEFPSKIENPAAFLEHNNKYWKFGKHL